MTTVKEEVREVRLSAADIKEMSDRTRWMRNPKLSAADKKLVGKTVVYRVHRYSHPKLGKLFSKNVLWKSGENLRPGREVGCWVVQDDADERTYCLETKNGATWRLAGTEDIAHYKGTRKARKIRVTETEALSAMELPAVPVPVKVEPKTKGIGDEIAKAVEQGVAKEKA